MDRTQAPDERGERVVVDSLHRVQAAFLEMPGLNLTHDQVRRLCALDAASTAAALRQLVDAGFLTRTKHAGFVRAS